MYLIIEDFFPSFIWWFNVLFSPLEKRERGGDNVMKMTPSILLNIVLVTVLALSFFSIHTAANTSSYETTDAGPEYDPWRDLNDDGIINIYDVVMVTGIYGSTGTPINKTELLLDLLDRVETLETMITSLQTRCRIIPNGDFEKGVIGMTENDIIDWNYELAVHQGNPPISKAFIINGDYYYNRFQSLYTYMETESVPPFPGDSRASQYLSTEQPVFTTANNITLWVGGYGYTTSSRYYNYITLILTDGTEIYSEQLRMDRWDGLHVNYYNEQEIGNDGNTWYRYTRQIPEYLDKSNLTVTIQHYQHSWDLTTTSSWFYLDGVYFSDANGNPV